MLSEQGSVQLRGSAIALVIYDERATVRPVHLGKIPGRYQVCQASLGHSGCIESAASTARC